MELFSEVLVIFWGTNLRKINFFVAIKAKAWPLKAAFYGTTLELPNGTFLWSYDFSLAEL